MSSSSSSRRPVARRACLACREKKIKCDGEPPVVGAAAQKNQPNANENPSTCSNCKFLGIKCVFVQSMRGGRRKKREHPESNNNFSPASTSERSRNKKETHVSSLSLPVINSTHHKDLLPGVSDITGASNQNQSRSASFSSISNQFPKDAAPYQSPRVSPTISNSSTTLSGLQDHYNRISKHNYDGESSSRRSPSSAYNPMGPEYNHPMPPPFHHGHPHHPHHPHHRHPHHRGPPLFHHGPPPHHMGYPPPPFHHGPPPPPPHMMGYQHHYGLPPPPPPPPSTLLPPINGKLKYGSGVSPSYRPGEYSSYYNRDMERENTEGRWDTKSQQSSISGSSSNDSEPRNSVSSKQGDANKSANVSTNVSTASVTSISPDEKKSSKGKVSKSASSKVTGEDTLSTISETSNTNKFHISDDVLKSYDLPDWGTFCTLIDLYYKYLYLGQQFLPPKSTLLENFSINTDSSILHTMFSVSCKFSSPVNVTTESYRDSTYWASKISKNWHRLNLVGQLQVYSLISTSFPYFANKDKSESVLESITKSSALIKLNNMISFFKDKPVGEYDELLSLLTKRQINDNESLVRMIWSLWMNSVELRLISGKNFNKLNNLSVEFPDSLQLPVPNEKYLINGSDISVNCKPSNWEDIQSSSMDGPNEAVYSSIANILCVKLLQEVMDIISRNGLLPSNLVKIDSQLSSNFRLCEKFYEIINASTFKKILIINYDHLADNFILNTIQIITHQNTCNNLLLFKTPQSSNESDSLDLSKLSLFSDFSFKDLQVDDIPQILSQGSPSDWNSLINCITATLDIIKLIEVGEGLVPENYSSARPIAQEPSMKPFNASSTLPVLIGPCSYDLASNLGTEDNKGKNWWEVGLVTKTPMASIPPGEPDTWLQYPVSSIKAVCTAVPLLATFIIISKYAEFQIKPDSQEPGECNTKIINIKYSGNFENQLDETNFSFKLSGNVSSALTQEFKTNFLTEKFITCSRFLRNFSKISEFASEGLVQIDKIGPHIDEIAKHIEKNMK